jgi:predicted trehalose synthase
MRDLAKALAAGDTAALPGDALAEWLTVQRWFGSKSREVSEFQLLDVVVLRPIDPLVAIVIVEARFGTGTHELYQVPIGVRPIADGWEDGVICRTDAYVVYDALVDRVGDAVLAAALAGTTVIERPAGHVRFHWDAAVAPPASTPRTRPMGAEQSNTSVVFDERLVLKVFRRIEPGINPELEMLRFLAARGFTNVASLAGWYGYTGDLMDATLGVMQRFMTDARDGWDLALDSIAAGDGSFLGRLTELGQITGRMHTTLASDSSDPDFSPEEASSENVSLLTATIDEQIERLFVDLPEDHPALAPIAGRGEELRDHLRSLSHTGAGGRLIRLHGDYHLGQTVNGPEGWVILDFEGEPERPLLERRRKRSPLRDVAGMLRSFTYAASGAALVRGASVPDGWEPEARSRFLDGYRREIDQALLPAGETAIAKLLGLFELEKAVYELRYEFNHRPEWVGIPVAGLVRLLEQTPS